MAGCARERAEPHKKLIHLRLAIPALSASGFAPLLVDDRQDVYAYLRCEKESDSMAIVVLNFSANLSTVRVAIPSHGSGRRLLREVLPGRRTELKGDTLAVSLPTWGVRIYVWE